VKDLKLTTRNKHFPESAAPCAVLPLSTEASRAEALAALADQQFALDRHAIVGITDVRGTITYANEMFCAISGYSREELLGENHRILKSGQHPAEFFREMYRTIASGKVWRGDICNKAKGGRLYWVATTIVPIPGPDEKPRQYIAIRLDVTDRKTAERTSEVLAKRLALATDIADVGVWEWNPATNDVLWDSTMCRIYGVNETTRMPFEAWMDAIGAEDRARVRTTLRGVVEEKRRGDVEFRVTSRDGTSRYISSAQVLMADETGGSARVVGVNVEITKRKEAEKSLEQKHLEQVRFKDEFLSHVSHELRSPLTAIKQFSSILSLGLAGPLNEEQKQYQEIVSRNVAQLQAMIEDLLEVTRLETGKINVDPESVSVREAVTDATNTLRGAAGEKGVSLGMEVDGELPPVLADPMRLRQCLIILLDNAVKFTPRGGEVTVSAWRDAENAKTLIFEVADSGCGIPAEDYEKIFQRLYQRPGATETSRAGLGLGLYICKELLQRQGGNIEVRPREGRGTIFSFTLPVFSLDELIAPLLKNNRWPADSVALLVVDVCSTDGQVRENYSPRWIREIRELVQRCLLPDLDVLLPKMNYGPVHGRFFVLAFADEKGVGVLANRIQEQFLRSALAKESGLDLRVSINMLQSFPPETQDSLNKIVNALNANLREELILN
jgi:two-component system, sensor histidine kinase and response regulator